MRTAAKKKSQYTAVIKPKILYKICLQMRKLSIVFMLEIKKNIVFVKILI